MTIRLISPEFNREVVEVMAGRSGGLKACNSDFCKRCGPQGNRGKKVVWPKRLCTSITALVICSAILFQIHLCVFCASVVNLLIDFFLGPKD